MLDQNDVDRRLDLATAYFEAEDDFNCKMTLVNLIKEPELDILDRFAAQVQLVYNAQTWSEGEKYRKDAKKTFAEIEANTPVGTRDRIAIYRFVLEELVEWQDEEKRISAAQQQVPVAPVKVAKKNIAKLRQKQR